MVLKYLKSLAAPAVLCAAALVAFSCESSQPEEQPQDVTLATPAPEIVSVGATDAVLSWPKVAGAISYSVWFQDDENPDMAIDTCIVLRKLEPETSYSVCVTAEPASRSGYSSSAKSNPLQFTTEAKPVIDSPEAVVSELTTTSFTLSWSPVEKAGSYVYVFNSDPEVSITDTLVNFTSLTPGETVKINLRAVPDEDNEEVWAPSRWKEISVDVPSPVVLAVPVLTVERASSIHTVISWEEVEGADGYEYSLDGEDAVSTVNLSVSFDGLERDSDHVFKVRACSDDEQVAVSSEWAEVSFKAVYDFVRTLAISNAEATDRKVSFEVTASESESHYRGVLPKALYMTEDGQIDTLAVMSEGEQTTLRSTGGKVTATSGICYATTYLCYCFDVDEDGSSLKETFTAVEVKTKDYDYAPEDGAYWSTGTFLTLEAYPGYAYSSTSGILDPLSYVGFAVSRQDESVTLSEVKYYIFTLSTFKSKFGGTGVDVADTVKEYFQSGGSAVSSANLQKINSGSVYSIGYSGREEDSSYVIAIMATTSDGQTLVSAQTVRTALSDMDWVHISGSSDGSFTVTSDLPVVSGAKAVRVNLTTSTNRYTLLDSYVKSKGSALSDARIQALNDGTGYTASYSSTSSATTYIYILNITNKAGDTVTRAALIRSN